MQVDLAATNSLSSSPRFWTAITQSVFRLKENSWLADEMTCFCLCHRRCCSCIREASGGWNCWEGGRLESPNGATTSHLSGKRQNNFINATRGRRFGWSASCAHHLKSRRRNPLTYPKRLLITRYYQCWKQRSKGTFDPRRTRSVSSIP